MFTLQHWFSYFQFKTVGTKKCRPISWRIITRTYGGSIRWSNMSVFCFSSISSAVLCWTMFSRLSAYFSSFCSMLSIMSNFLWQANYRNTLSHSTNAVLNTTVNYFFTIIICYLYCFIWFKLDAYSKLSLRENLWDSLQSNKLNILYENWIFFKLRYLQKLYRHGTIRIRKCIYSFTLFCSKEHASKYWLSFVYVSDGFCDFHKRRSFWRFLGPAFFHQSQDARMHALRFLLRKRRSVEWGIGVLDFLQNH